MASRTRRARHCPDRRQRARDGFQLTVGQSTETVSVSAEASQVETTTAAVSSLVNQTQMRELPLNGRDWEQLILLAPGRVELSSRAEARAR
jgi:hypothetical protein